MAEDPKLADRLSGTAEVRVHRRRATLAGLGFILGLVILVAGVQVHPALSIAGFLVMLAAVLLGINSWQRVGDDGAQPAKPSQPRPNPPTSDFMDRLEERWRRREQGDR